MIVRQFETPLFARRFHLAGMLLTVWLNGSLLEVSRLVEGVGLEAIVRCATSRVDRACPFMQSAGLPGQSTEKTPQRFRKSPLR